MDASLLFQKSRKAHWKGSERNRDAVALGRGVPAARKSVAASVLRGDWVPARSKPRSRSSFFVLSVKRIPWDVGESGRRIVMVVFRDSRRRSTSHPRLASSNAFRSSRSTSCSRASCNALSTASCRCFSECPNLSEPSSLEYPESALRRNQTPSETINICADNRWHLLDSIKGFLHIYILFRFKIKNSLKEQALPLTEIGKQARIVFLLHGKESVSAISWRTFSKNLFLLRNNGLQPP